MPRLPALFLAAAGLLGAECSPAAAQPFLPTPPLTVSTIPSNGDQNPYGVAFIGSNFKTRTGPLKSGDILVTNFNNADNLQGTGTTIVSVDPAGTATTFFTVPGAVLGGAGTGLSTALGTLRKGFVIVGSVPSSDGTAATSGPGSLLVIDPRGNLISTITDPAINGPWNMALVDQGKKAYAFVANVFAGTVSRVDLAVNATTVTVISTTVIASGYLHRPDAAGFAVGPCGLVYDANDDVLYVASTVDNAVFAISDPLSTDDNTVKGKLVYSDNNHLHGPLGMAEAPNGDLILANSDVINADPAQPSELVEFTKQGQFVKQLSVDLTQGGSFGLAIAVQSDPDASILAAVDDVTGSLILYTLPAPQP